MKTSDTLAFKVFCFEAYRAKHGMSGREAIAIFKKYGVLEYLGKFYSVLHTTGREYLIDDIDKFIEVRKDIA